MCLQPKPLVKSHIIPEALVRDMSPDGKAMLFDSQPGVMPKRAPVGIYDSGILCLECERRFGPADDCGIEFVRRPLSAMSVVKEMRQYRVFEAGGVDCAQLKLFFLSVLWRAHWSTHPFFADVRLGPREPALRDFLLAPENADWDEFPVSLFRYWGEPGPVMDTPFMTRFGSVRGCKFHFSLYDVIYLTGRDSGHPAWMDTFALRPGSSLIFMGSPLLDGPKATQIYRAAETLRNVEKTWPRMPKGLRDIREMQDTD